MVKHKLKNRRILHNIHPIADNTCIKFGVLAEMGERRCGDVVNMNLWRMYKMFSISYFIGTNKHNIKHRFSLYSAANMRRRMSTLWVCRMGGDCMPYDICTYIPVFDCMMCWRGYLISYYSFYSPRKEKRLLIVYSRLD